MNVNQDENVSRVRNKKAALIFLFLTCVTIVNLKYNSIGTYTNLSERITYLNPFGNFRSLEEDDDNKVLGLVKDYEFVNNITGVIFQGKWTNLEIKNNTFERSLGKMEMKIYMNTTIKNYIGNIEDEHSLVFFTDLNDGNYKDRWISLNFSIPLEKDFYKKISGVDPIRMSGNNITIHYQIAELFDNSMISGCNRTMLELEFIPSEKTFNKGYEYSNTVLYTKLTGRLHDQNCKLNLDFTLEVNDDIVSI
jgi:hypothetical protein